MDPCRVRMNERLLSPKPARYRAIFISDVHLGTRRAQIAALLDFLKMTESDWLYVVGDLIDNWALRKTGTGTSCTTT